MKEQDQVGNFIETSFKDKNERIRALAQWFYETVKNSGNFRWMGVGGVEDELGKYCLAVYLDEDRLHPENHRPVAIGEAYSALQMALKPDVGIYLYYMRESDDRTSLVERVMYSMKVRYSRADHDPKAEFLWEEYFSTP